MLIAEAETRLMAMLTDAGVTSGVATAADVPTIIEVYRHFAAIPVDDAAPAEEDGDAVLAQFGTHDFRGASEFAVDLTRQMVAAREGSPIWQLACTLYWQTDSVTSALASGELWSFGMTPDEFFTEAAALPGWKWALTGSRAPRDFVTTFDEV